MRRDYWKVWLCMVVITSSFLLSCYFVPMLDAQVVPGCLTKRGAIKRLNKPCKKNQQPVVLPLAETVDQLRAGIEELAAKHELPFHATIHVGEEAVLARAGGIQVVPQVVGAANAITQRTGSNVVAAAVRTRTYDVRLKLLNTGDAEAIYAGSGGTLKAQEAAEVAQWDVDETMTIGHETEDLVTAYDVEAGNHLQLDVSKIMLIAKPGRRCSGRSRSSSSNIPRSLTPRRSSTFPTAPAISDS